MLARALEEPPAPADRGAVVLELGQARARAGTPEAVAPLSEIVAHSNDEDGDRRGRDRARAACCSSPERAAEGAAILHRAQQRVPASGLGREQLDVALLGASYTSFSARRAAEPMIAALRDPGGPARSMLEATTLGDARDGRADVSALGRQGDGYAPARARRRSAARAAPGRRLGDLALAALAAPDELEAALRGDGRRSSRRPGTVARR